MAGNQGDAQLLFQGEEAGQQGAGICAAGEGYNQLVAGGQEVFPLHGFFHLGWQLVVFYSLAPPFWGCGDGAGITPY